jgi:hypothetical protein
MTGAAPTADLPAPVQRLLADFVAAARDTLGDDLRAIVLYGSAAEGRVRPTSDVNLILVLERFDPARLDRLREPFLVAQAGIRVAPMLLLASEIPAALEDFAVKFGDVLRRRRVLHGPDPFAGMSVSRPAAIARLRQVLLNLHLRLRAAYLARSLHDEQAASTVADAAGPLRAAAATLLELESTPAGSSREALERIVAEMPGPDWSDVLARVGDARQRRALPPGVAGTTLLRLIELAGRLHDRARRLV